MFFFARFRVVKMSQISRKLGWSSANKPLRGSDCTYHVCDQAERADGVSDKKLVKKRVDTMQQKSGNK